VILAVAHHARIANPAVGWGMLAGFAVALVWLIRSRRRG